MDFVLLENELKKRLKFEYKWGTKQLDVLDADTNFIYKINNFEAVLNKIDTNFKSLPNYISLKNYALNRWFNFWSAKAIEQMFCEHNNVKPHPNFKDKFTDFYINTIPFDHKTTIFPKGFKKSFPFAIEHKKELIEWLYSNQSKQQRQHFRNRLFIVLINTENTEEHWKLKAELSWLKNIISTYLCSFEVQKLQSFTFNNTTIKADIIWAIK